jgi:hypothetical protein
LHLMSATHYNLSNFGLRLLAEIQRQQRSDIISDYSARQYFSIGSEVHKRK